MYEFFQRTQKSYSYYNGSIFFTLGCYSEPDCNIADAQGVVSGEL